MLIFDLYYENQKRLRSETLLMYTNITYDQFCFSILQEALRFATEPGVRRIDFIIHKNPKYWINITKKSVGESGIKFSEHDSAPLKV